MLNFLSCAPQYVVLSDQPTNYSVAQPGCSALPTARHCTSFIHHPSAKFSMLLSQPISLRSSRTPSIFLTKIKHTFCIYPSELHVQPIVFFISRSDRYKSESTVATERTASPGLRKLIFRLTCRRQPCRVMGNWRVDDVTS